MIRIATLIQFLIWREIIVWVWSLKWNWKLIISWWSSKNWVLSTNKIFVHSHHRMLLDLCTNLHMISWSNLVSFYHKLGLWVVNLNPFKNLTATRIVHPLHIRLILECLAIRIHYTSLTPLWCQRNSSTHRHWLCLLCLLHLKHCCLKRCHIFAWKNFWAIIRELLRVKWLFHLMV